MAKLHDLVTLRVRLSVLIALVVTIVVGLAAYLQTQEVESRALRDLLDTARSTAQVVADDVEIRPDALDDPDGLADLNDSLREFADAVPFVRGISVVVMRDGKPIELASTASGPRPEVLDVGRRSIEREDTIWGGGDQDLIKMVAVPTYRADAAEGQEAPRAQSTQVPLFGAVVVSFSQASVEQLHRSVRSVVFWFVPAAIVLLTLLVDLLVRRLIHLPIRGIRNTMQRVAKGDLAARAPVIRQDEIGAVASGLNEMLVEMEVLNHDLQSRVDEATEELRKRNVELVETYQRVFGLREALARAEQMAAVGQTAASVAHQIGTPLNLISGYVQMLMQESGSDSRVARRLEIVQEQISKVATIVRSMLDHARLPSPKQESSIAAIVQRVCDVSRPKLDASGVRLQVRIEDGLPSITADAVQLELALLNLVTNALDAMPDGGLLTIGVGPCPLGVRIEVADTGKGIADDLVPRIFEPWVTTKAAGHGSGLGLSITREVVRTHGGTIDVRTEPGRGAAFTIELPAAPVRAA